MSDEHNIPPRVAHPFFVENPLSNDDDPAFQTHQRLRVRRLSAVLRNPAAPPGTPQVDWTIRYAATRSAVGTELVTGGTATTSTTGVVITSFDEEFIPAGSWVWLELPTVTSGADRPLSFAVTLEACVVS